MKIIKILLLAALLSGCAEITPLLIDQGSDQSAWEQRQQQLKNIESWTITGRVAVQADKESWTATLHWQQANASYTMRFIAPLGQGTYQLSGDSQSVSLLTADNNVYKAADPESLLLNNLGWSVPLHGLRYWVRGMPEPGIEMESLVIDNLGRMTDLSQSGWRISISRYATHDKTELPGKLFMWNDRFKLRIVVQDWTTES